jgi:hypothetical protein
MYCWIIVQLLEDHPEFQPDYLIIYATLAVPLIASK